MQTQVYITYRSRPGGSSDTAKFALPGVDSVVLDRFWSKVRPAANGCWEWTAGRINGLYGQFSIQRDGKQVHIPAHRFSWTLANGPIPPGLWVLHTCDNWPCVNPDHLFLGTHLDNMRDAASKRRLSVSRPKRHKVTDAQVAEIRARAAGGVRQCVLAHEFGVTEAWISMLLRWKRRQYGPPRLRAA